MHMDIIQDINTAKAYLEGMLRAALAEPVLGELNVSFIEE